MGIRSEFAKGYLAGKRGDEGIARREIEREGGREAESRSRRAEAPPEIRADDAAVPRRCNLAHRSQRTPQVIWLQYL